MDFTEKLRLREKAIEDLYFAEVDRQLIEAMHEKQRQEEPERIDSTPQPLSGNDISK
ncbi:hypothetical protein ACPV5J_09115 [Vibrio rotiferianus]|jgi:hypothetical protein|uniref:hypothetical protein n=1 Tax=Vibrio rotiferianus TaxID=190895 RepID=UPI0015874EFE|nr:hypothetical protein [Vibrio rotiferianus]